MCISMDSTQYICDIKSINQGCSKHHINFDANPNIICIELVIPRKYFVRKIKFRRLSKKNVTFY